jgi:hypothetical protein
LDMDHFDPSRGIARGGDGEVGGGERKCFRFCVLLGRLLIPYMYADIFWLGV